VARRHRNPFGATDDLETLEVAKDALREENFANAVALLKNVSRETLSAYVMEIVRRYKPANTKLYGPWDPRLPDHILRRNESQPDAWTFVYIADPSDRHFQVASGILGDMCERIQDEEDPLFDGCWHGVEYVDRFGKEPIQYIYVVPFSRDLRISGIGYPWWKIVPDEVEAEYARIGAPKPNPPERDLEQTIIDLAMQGQPDVLADFAIEAELVPPDDPFGYEEYRKQHPDQDPEKDRTYWWSKAKEPAWRSGEFAVEQPADYPRSLVWWMARRGGTLGMSTGRRVVGVRDRRGRGRFAHQPSIRREPGDPTIVANYVDVMRRGFDVGVRMRLRDGAALPLVHEEVAQAASVHRTVAAHTWPSRRAPAAPRRTRRAAPTLPSGRG
jgi:hypothetical protein